MAILLSLFSENTYCLETGYLVYVSGLVVSDHAISGLGNGSPSSLQIQAHTNIPARVCLLMCTKCSTPITVFLSPLFTSIHFGIYFGIILTMARTFKLLTQTEISGLVFLYSGLILPHLAPAFSAVVYTFPTIAKPSPSFTFLCL